MQGNRLEERDEDGNQQGDEDAVGAREAGGEQEDGFHDDEGAEEEDGGAFEALEAVAFDAVFPASVGHAGEGGRAVGKGEDEHGGFVEHHGAEAGGEDVADENRQRVGDGAGGAALHVVDRVQQAEARGDEEDGGERPAQGRHAPRAAEEDREEHGNQASGEVDRLARGFGVPAADAPQDFAGGEQQEERRGESGAGEDFAGPAAHGAASFRAESRRKAR